eukprot:CAMPEP_0119056164 /NCGR_PEP_ID=MMETSP1178-20130426/871_1 /TAXON_ID=33656 /ORGANISM="unid sp, Strain CCMP2000" /LENGTH=202 /DNA_ID=CAMNT_0007036867 /DNA_START=58 /DNA_END=666 /DNA_ORIENTATION=+
MVIKLHVTKTGVENGPSATLRVEFAIGDAAFALGTDSHCLVLFPPSQGVERWHCTLSLRSHSSGTRGAEDSEWQLTPRDGTIRVPALANTDDGGFCQVLQEVQEHSAPGWQPLQFVMAEFDCVAEFEADNFGVAEFANANGLGLRVGARAAQRDAPPPSEAPTPHGMTEAAAAAAAAASHSPGGMPVMRNYAWGPPEGEADS